MARQRGGPCEQRIVMTGQRGTPGPLSRAHAFIRNDCAACHTSVAGVTRAKCVACHADDTDLVRLKPTAFVLIAVILNVLAAGDAATAAPVATANGAASWQPPLTTDPIAQVPWLSVGDWYSPSFHSEAGSSNAITVRLLVPFDTGPLKHVFRTTIPFNIKAPPTEAQNDTSENISDLPLGASNLGDITLYDLIVFPLLIGRLGIGPELQLPTAVNRASGSGQWSAGPAAGFVTERGPWQLGLFSQSLFSFAASNSNRSSVRQSKIAPIIKYSVGDGWSVGSSSMGFAYSWHRHSWRNVPVGLKVSKLTSFGQRPINLTGEAEYNLMHHDFTPEWTLRFTVLFFFP